MDQIKDILAVVKKHHFWLLCAIAALAILGSWYTTTGTLATEMEDNKKQIDGKITSITQITRDPEHPTDAHRAAVEKREEALRTMTMEAWRTFYESQKKLFQWPEELPRFQNLDEDDEITQLMRRDYKNYVYKQFPKLYQLVKLREVVEEEGAAGGDYARSRASNLMPRYRGIVDWDLQQREALEAQYQFEGDPTQLQVRLTHEDITVYRALLSIIRDTNQVVGATDNRNAAVKRINYLDIGAAFWAPQQADSAQAIIMPPAAAGADNPYATQPAATQSVYGPDTGGDAGSLDELWLTNRYLDEQWKPVAGAAALQNPPFAEFKQMPVRMGLTVDQRRIPLLLAACANSPLTVEVRQLRINPGHPEATSIVQKTNAQVNQISGTGQRNPYESTGRTASSSIRRPKNTIRRNPYGSSSARGGLLDEEQGANDMDIEIRGIVYIYNKPDKDKLGTGTATDATQRLAAGFPQIEGGGIGGGLRGGGRAGSRDG